MSCANGVGWQGYLLAAGKMLPFLSCDIVKTQEILPSASVHGLGAGSINPVARDQHNFSLGKIITEGTVNVEVFQGSGNYAEAFTNMLNRTIGASSVDMSDVCNGFDSSNKLIFSPAGGSELVMPDPDAANGKAIVNSLELRGNPGGNVQANFGVMSAGATWNNPDSGSPGPNAPSSSAWAFETAGATDDSNPVPFYSSNFTVTGSGESDITDRITDWNISINNSATPLYVFNGSAFPVDIFLGQREVTGSFSYYSTDGVFVEFMSHGASCTITFGDVTLTMPFISMNPNPIPNQGPNAVVTRTVNFRAFAKSASLPSIYQS